MALLWSADTSRVERILLPSTRPWTNDSVERMFPEARSSSEKRMGALASGIASFLSGYAVELDAGLLNLWSLGPFQRKVLLAESRIPRGRISTYGRIARHVGRPGAARAVGNALSNNPFPIVIPCHRALRADLTLGGYQGGPAMKRRLLEMEGIRFEPSGRAFMDAIYY